jgi:DNA-binding MarR family transcriptional regulator
MAQAAGRDGDCFMIPGGPKLIPENILKNSVLAHIAAAYFSVGQQSERKTGCSATRGFILSTLRGGAALNQNQIAKLLGFDRTVVHRTIKTLVREGLVAEKQASSGRAILLSLIPKGNRYRKSSPRLELPQTARVAADEKIRKLLSESQRSELARLLEQISELVVCEEQGKTRKHSSRLAASCVLSVVGHSIRAARVTSNG